MVMHLMAEIDRSSNPEPGMCKYWEGCDKKATHTWMLMCEKEHKGETEMCIGHGVRLRDEAVRVDELTCGPCFTTAGVFTKVHFKLEEIK